jgi:hypothetical protein
MTVTLTTQDVTAEDLDHGDVGQRKWLDVGGVAHRVVIWQSFRDPNKTLVYHTLNGNRLSLLYYSTPFAALAAFHAIGPGIHPPRLLTERETEIP